MVEAYFTYSGRTEPQDSNYCINCDNRNDASSCHHLLHMEADDATR